MSNLRKKKLKLWYANPHCENCGKLTMLPEQHPNVLRKDDGQMYFKKDTPHNIATIQHKYFRLHPLRHARVHFNERRLYLSCYECNKKYYKDFEEPVNKQRQTKYNNENK